MELFKGELIEEKLRLYFLNSGYYVVRGIIYYFERNEITDIDLFLYGRVSIMRRERTNVDIKNKKSPKAFERILWAKGLQQLLGFDSCVVATSEKKESVKNYAMRHNTTLLDGNFLQKLNYDLANRLSEEEFLTSLSKIISYKEFNNQTWKTLYEASKSRLLDELDFSGYNKTVLFLRYFLKNYFDPQKKEIALRAIYIFLSHSLLILDYLLKDIAFLEHEARKQVLGAGFKYGNLGEDGINRTIEMALKIANSKVGIGDIKKSLNAIEIDILKDYFSKNEIIKSVFKSAIAFEKHAFNRVLTPPNELEADLKSNIAVMLDYFKINRKQFFGA